MDCNLPKTDKKRVVIVGGGFGGLKTARKLNRSGYEVVLVDRNNFHQFPPLLYQVASAGLEPSSILFPFRKIFRNHRDFHFRVGTVEAVDPRKKTVRTDHGELSYDYLVLAAGTTTNFFGNARMEENALAMKTVQEALAMRNAILANFEKALNCVSDRERRTLLNIVIVGGGPSGVEVAGALAEMRSHVLNKDYPDLDLKDMHIYLVEGSPKLLGSMSEEASQAAEKFLRDMGVTIVLNTRVNDFTDKTVLLGDGTTLPAETVIWVSGVTANRFEGIPEGVLAKGGRIQVDEFNRVTGFEDIFAIGDVCSMPQKAYPNGHPQLAQVAIQQGKNLAMNLRRLSAGKPMEPFRYRDKGSLATVGRNKAVADLKKIKMHGFLAWVIWLGVHLTSILGARNKMIVLINWGWYYFSYDADLRLILRSKDQPQNRTESSAGAEPAGNGTARPGAGTAPTSATQEVSPTAGSESFRPPADSSRKVGAPEKEKEIPVEA